MSVYFNLLRQCYLSWSPYGTVLVLLFITSNPMYEFDENCSEMCVRIVAK
jgi:hypothetical protein